jgi:hypothetical protein
MWCLAGKKFSWSRDQDGRLRAWLYPEWHALTPNLNQQYPDFEFEEVLQLNRLKAYVAVEAGTSDDLVRDVKDHHRSIVYTPDVGDDPQKINAMVSLIDSQICIEARMPETLLEKFLGDMLATASQPLGYYKIFFGDRFLDLTTSIGVKIDAKKLFLDGELPILARGRLQYWCAVGDELPKAPTEQEISNALVRMAHE